MSETIEERYERMKNGEGMNNDDGVQQKRPDGTWGPAVPLPYPPTWIERVKKFLGLPTWETRKHGKRERRANQ